MFRVTPAPPGGDDVEHMCDPGRLGRSPGRVHRQLQLRGDVQKPERTEEDDRVHPWSSTTQAPPPPLDRPVWVDLDRFYGDPDPTTTGFEGTPPGGYLKATGRVPGTLKRWTRAVDGRWFGRVDFSVCDAYGAVQVRHEATLVPAAALSPRAAELRR
jgi:hypothetical protein